MSKISQLKKKLKNTTQKEKPLNINENELIIKLLTNETDWNIISHKDLSTEFVMRYQDNLNWDIICSKINFPKKYFSLFKDKLNWDVICKYRELTPALIKVYDKHMNWELVGLRGKITDEIFENYFEQLYLNCDLWKIFNNPYFNVKCNTLEKYIEYFDNQSWNSISGYKGLEENFIDKYSDRLNWNIISTEMVLSEYILIKYKNKINWNRLNHKNYFKHSNNFISNSILPNITNSYTILDLLEFTLSEKLFINITDPNIWKAISYSGNISLDFVVNNKNKLIKDGLLNNKFLYLKIDEIERIYSNGKSN